MEMESAFFYCAGVVCSGGEWHYAGGRSYEGAVARRQKMMVGRERELLEEMG